jgi:hypothetical protein
MKKLIFYVLLLSFALSPGCTTGQHTSDLLAYRDASGKERRIVTKEAWELKRKEILASLEAAMGNSLIGPACLHPTFRLWTA